MPTYTVHNRASGARFTVRDDETVLAAALRQGRCPAHQCRAGRCGRCAAQLLAGRVAEDHPDPDPLDAGARAGGGILLCRARARSDLEIEIEELPASGPVVAAPARVTRLHPLARDVMGLWLRLPVGVDLGLRPGQYLDLVWPDGRRRSYSPARAGAREFELHVRRVPGGWFSEQLFSGAIKEKAILQVEGPFGSACLRSGDPRPVILMAGGTGIAPMHAILEALADGPGPCAHLFWGARSRSDLYLDARLRRRLAQWDGSYTPVLSEPDPDWEGETGWVHEAVCRAFPDLSGHVIYAAGPPAMVDAGARAFGTRGLAAANYLSDAFYYAAD